MKLYRLPVVTGRAEPQEGVGMAQAWIVDPKVHPGIPMIQADPQKGGGIAQAWIVDPKGYPGIPMPQ